MALEEPIRAELFSAERLEQHAESLAAAQRVTTTPRKGGALLARVLDNGRVLLESYRAIAQAIREERAITPAAEWLVDNYHIVDEQLREIRDDLPPAFTESCRSWLRVTSRAIRASMGWPGRSSPIRTAGLTRRCSVGSCAPTSACNH